MIILTRKVTSDWRHRWHRHEKGCQPYSRENLIAKDRIHVSMGYAILTNTRIIRLREPTT
jgi:hypothetical protein